MRAHGARICRTGGASYLDYGMDAGRLLAGHGPAPVVEAVSRAMQVGTAPRVELAELFGWPARSTRTQNGARAQAAALARARNLTWVSVDRGWGREATLEAIAARRDCAVVVAAADPDLDHDDPAFVTRLGTIVHEAGGIVVLDETRTWRRLPDPPADLWDLRIVGDSAAGGLPFGALIAKDEALLGTGRSEPAHHAALAAAAALVTGLDGNTARQLAGRAERLASGVCEVAAGAGLQVRAVQPGGMFRLHFTSEAEAAGVPVRFAREMEKRHFLVPDRGTWWPSLSHDFFDVESTVDAAAAAMAVSA